MNEKKFLSVKDMALIALFVAVTAVCSWISIPIGTVPFTLQTLAVMTAAAVLGTKRGTITVIVYILLGIIGVPVFSGFTAGISVIVGPAGGYVIGFIFEAVIIGIITKGAGKDRKPKTFVRYALALLAGEAACFFFGTVWYVIQANVSVLAALLTCVVPFIIPDIVKLVIASVIAVSLRPVLDRL